jgi:hypothetical protein
VTALEQALGRLGLLQAAVSEGDSERADLLIAELVDDVWALAGRPALAHVDHVCVVCSSDCDVVSDLRRPVRLLERDAQRLALELVETRELREFAEQEIARRWPA